MKSTRMRRTEKRVLCCSSKRPRRHAGAKAKQVYKSQKRLGFASTSYNIIHFSALNGYILAAAATKNLNFAFCCTIHRLSRHTSSLVFAAFFPFAWTHFYVQFVNLFSVVCLYAANEVVCRTYLFFARLWMTHDGFCVVADSTPKYWDCTKNVECGCDCLTFWLYIFIEMEKTVGVNERIRAFLWARICRRKPDRQTDIDECIAVHSP